MVKWEVRFKKSAAKDARRVAAAGLKNKVQSMLEFISHDPLRVPPPCENLIGDLAGLFSRRITLKHRLVYEVVPESREV